MEGRIQNQRSAGKSAFMTTSAIRKRSMKILPSMSSPSMWRIGLRAPSATISQSASSV